MILELLYNVWFGGAILWMLNAFSVLCFGKHKWSCKQAFGLCWFIIIWPLAVLSPEGRAHLLGKFHQL